MNALSEFNEEAPEQSALKSSGLAIADQAVASLGRFVVGMGLAILLSPADYGLYVLTLGVYFLLGAIHTSLVAEPFMIHGAPLPCGAFLKYLGGTARTHWLFMTAFFLLASVAFPLSSLARTGVSLPIAFWPAIIAVAGMLTQSFHRSLSLARGRPAGALTSDTAFVVLQITGLWWQSQHGGLSLNSILLVQGIAGFLAATLVPRGFIRPLLLLGPVDSSAFGRNLAVGKWLAGSSVASWASSQAGIFVAASLLGPEASGTLRACQNLLAPTYVLLTGMEGVLTPTASRRVAHGGVKALARYLALSGATLTGIVAGYALLVSLFANPLLAFTYGGKYSGLSAVVLLMSIQYVGLAAMKSPTVGLKVTGGAHYLLKANIIAAGVTILLSMVLVPAFGLVGAAHAVTWPSLLTAGMLWMWYGRNKERREASSPEMPPLPRGYHGLRRHD